MIVSDSEMIDFIATQMWIRKTKITPDSDIRQLLGDNYRSRKLLEILVMKYQVNMEEFIYSKHFLNRERPIWSFILAFMIISLVAGIIFIRPYPLLGIFFIILIPAMFFTFIHEQKTYKAQLDRFANIPITPKFLTYVVNQRSWPKEIYGR